MAGPSASRAIGYTALALCVLTALALRPVAAPLLLGIWAARLARPWLLALERRGLGRAWAAGLLTFALLLLASAPIAFVFTHVGKAGAELVYAVQSARGPRGALEALVSDHEPAHGEAPVRELLQQHQEQGASVAKVGGLVGVGTLLFLFFLCLAAFATFTGGDRFLEWARPRSGLRPAHFDRLGGAFTETGRGLFTSVGLTCLTQGILCTVIFAALGVPRALVLGLLCAIFAVLPIVGTVLVWAPVAAGLWLTGSTAKAILMVVLGGAVIGAIEFLIGPSFAKLGRFRLPSPLILLGMFAGVLGLGADGIILGPLLLRLAQEALDCARDARDPAPAEV